MGLKSGQTNNPDGRPVGSKNKRTEQWEILSESIMSNHTKRFNKALEKLNDVEFIKAYISILSYFKPKLKNTEIDHSSKDGTMSQNKTDISKLSKETLQKIADELEDEC